MATAMLRVLLATTNPVDGLTVAAEVKRFPPRVYAALVQLEDAGWVESSWQAPAPGERLRRRLYRLTPGGRVAAAREVAARRPEPARSKVALPRPVSVLRRIPALLWGSR